MFFKINNFKEGNIDSEKISMYIDNDLDIIIEYE